MLGFIVFIITPILFVSIPLSVSRFMVADVVAIQDIFFICVWHHLLQNPGMIKPDIGKLPKAIVDRIPLVYYIPPQPWDNLANDSNFSFLPSVVTLFVLLHSGFRGTTPTNQLRNWTQINFWANNWEQGQYPFVTLEGTRATWTICLMIPRHPPRRKVTNSEVKPASENKTVEEQTTQTSTSDPGETNTGPNILKLQDAGVGP